MFRLFIRVVRLICLIRDSFRQFNATDIFDIQRYTHAAPLGLNTPMSRPVYA